MFERFSSLARTAVDAAYEEAQRLGHEHVGTEHQLLGLLAIEAGGAYALLTEEGVTRLDVEAAALSRLGGFFDIAALAAVGVDIEAVREAVDERFGDGALDRALAPQPRCARPTLTPRAKKVLELALREAMTLGHQRIDTEHLLLGLVREGTGLAAQTLTALLPDVDLRARVLDRLAAKT